MNHHQSPSGTKTALSVIIPAYNEQATIGTLVSEISTTLKSMKVCHEIIVVNDGSTDGTREELVPFEKDNVIILGIPSKSGSGTARAHGMRRAKGEWIAWIDGDGTYAADDLGRLWNHRHPDTHLIGRRPPDAGFRNFPRRFAKTIFRKLVACLWRSPVPDLNSGLRLFPRSQALVWLHALPKGFSCASVATLASLHHGFRIDYIDIGYAPRHPDSRSQFRPILDSLNLVKQIVFWRCLREGGTPDDTHDAPLTPPSPATAGISPSPSVKTKPVAAECTGSNSSGSAEGQ